MAELSAPNVLPTRVTALSQPHCSAIPLLWSRDDDNDPEDDNDQGRPRKKAKMEGCCQQFSLMDLPPEILLMVLNWLPTGQLHTRVALVCKHFLALSRDDSLNQTWTIYSSTSSIKILSHLYFHMQPLQHLRLMFVKNGEASFRITLLNDVHLQVPALPKLTLSGYKGASSLPLLDLAFGHTFRALTELHLVDVTMHAPLLSQLIRHRGSVLRTLSIAGAGVDGSCRNVRQLANDKYSGLETCLQLQHLAVPEIVNPPFLESLVPLRQLRHLELTNICSHHTKRNHFAALFSRVHWQNLRLLTLERVVDFDLETWACLWKAAPLLERLQLKGCKRLAFSSVLDMCPTLHHHQHHRHQKGGSLQKLLLLEMPRMALRDVLLAAQSFPRLEFMHLTGIHLQSTLPLAALLAGKPELVAAINQTAYFTSQLSSTALAGLYSKHKEELWPGLEFVPL